MINIVIIAVLVLIAAGVGFYLYRAKKSGAACVGCPHGKECAKKCSGGCNCGQEEKK